MCFYFCFGCNIDIINLDITKEKGKILMSRGKKFAIVGVVFALIVVICWSLIYTINANVSPALYIAHRGHGHYDNTAEAFYNSTDYWGIECDVRVTKDNQLILNHDPDVVFEDGITMTVAESNLVDLLSKKLDGGYSMCEFSTYLEICEELGKVAVIELKGEYSDNEISMLINQIEQYYDADKVVIISFSQNNLLKVKEQSSIELQYLFTENTPEAFQFCFDNDINPSINFARLKATDVKNVHNHNLKIGVWTVNLMTANVLMKEFGVDFITSDYFCS